MKTINRNAEKTQPSNLVEGAAPGEEVAIAKAGKPLAEPVQVDAEALNGQQPRRLGVFEGKHNIPDDFDAPLPDDLLALFYEGALFPGECDEP